MTSIEKRFLQALYCAEGNALTAGQVGFIVWGPEKFKAFKVWPENATNRFCRPAGRVLHSLRRQSKVWGRFENNQFKWRLRV